MKIFHFTTYIFLFLSSFLFLFYFCFLEYSHFQEFDLFSPYSFRVLRDLSIISELKNFLNGEIESIKKEITEGNYKIKVSGKRKKMESNYHPIFVGVRIYKKEKPICSIVMYPGRYNNFLEISRRKKRGEYLNIGKQGTKILNILKQKVKTEGKGKIRVFKHFDEATFKQIDSRLSYQIYKQNSRESDSISRLGIFINTVEEVNEISPYQIKPAYVEDFLSGFYPELKTFNRFGFYYKMIQDFNGGRKRLIELFRNNLNNKNLTIQEAIVEISKKFSSYSSKEVKELLYCLNLFSINDIIKKKNVP